MRYIGWNLALAAWLLISAFALGHSMESGAATGLLAVLIGCFGIAGAGLPGLRVANAALAILLAWAALLMPDVSAIGRLNNGIVAALVFALSVVPGRAARPAPARAATPEPAPAAPKA